MTTKEVRMMEKALQMLLQREDLALGLSMKQIRTICNELYQEYLEVEAIEAKLDELLPEQNK